MGAPDAIVQIGAQLLAIFHIWARLASKLMCSAFCYSELANGFLIKRRRPTRWRAAVFWANRYFAGLAVLSFSSV